jgi:RNA polymerase sigma factor for flagellar operon FliA
VAVHLERLIHRDGLSVEQACATLRTNFQVAESPQDLRQIAARLPARVRRTFVSDSVLEDHPTQVPLPDAGLEEREASEHLGRALQALDEARRGLSAIDQLILRMRFEEGLTVAKIARALRMDQKVLYRRIDGTLRVLRGNLERTGLVAGDIVKVFAVACFDTEPSEKSIEVRLQQRGSSSYLGGRVS